MARVYALQSVVGLALLMMTGCGGETIIPVSGVVRNEGEVLSAGRVNFAPVGGGKPAAAVIQPDGRFDLEVATDRQSKSADYCVTVVCEHVVRNRKRDVLFVGPRDRPLQVATGAENDFEVEIDLRDGWKMVND